NGAGQGHITGIRVSNFDGPITDVTSNDVICNGGINPYHQPMSQVIITANAGDEITAEWHHTLAGADSSDPGDPIDSSHKGPILASLAKIPNALQTDVTGNKWFKIYEDGYSNSSGLWAVDKLIANKGRVIFSLPSCIAAGQYLLRVELIALHAASSYPGTELYASTLPPGAMECAQLQINRGESSSPATANLPGAYSGTHIPYTYNFLCSGCARTDSGIMINIYYPPVTSYTIPGPPPVFSCSGNPNGSTSRTSSTPSASPTPVPGSSIVAQYGQCGWNGYTGSTTCAAPYTCRALNV
ncbi:glycosyl hydrolase family 61-domain-containing protein, partial [Vararia minispora EC-137]